MQSANPTTTSTRSGAAIDRREPPPPRDSLIDLVHLARQTFGDKRLEAELLRLFLRQAEQVGKVLDVASAEASRPEGDLAAEAAHHELAVVHLLSGSASAVGAARVAELAAGIETRLRRKGPGGGRLAPSDCTALRRALDETTAFIGLLLDSP